jgi:hypothetical protein
MEVSGQLHAMAALPLEKEPLISSGGSWVGPRASLDCVEKRKISSPYWEWNPSDSIHSLLLY